VADSAPRLSAARRAGANPPKRTQTAPTDSHAGLVSHQERTGRFAHDRIQQAAYSLIPDEHPRSTCGSAALLASIPADQLADHLFDVANQLNRGGALLVDRDEKAHVAAINLRAGRKAKMSTAYASARVHFAAGIALLDERDWGGQYELRRSASGSNTRSVNS
jgi:predicted ATPase